MIFPLEEEHLQFIRVFDNQPEQKPFTWMTVFVKNKQEVTRFGFKESYEAICRYLNEQSVNYGILMFSDGIHILSEVPLKFDPLVVKMTTGLNAGKSANFSITKWLKKSKITGHDHLLREKNDKN